MSVSNGSSFAHNCSNCFSFQYSWKRRNLRYFELTPTLHKMSMWHVWMAQRCHYTLSFVSTWLWFFSILGYWLSDSSDYLSSLHFVHVTSCEIKKKCQTYFFNFIFVDYLEIWWTFTKLYFACLWCAYLLHYHEHLVFVTNITFFPFISGFVEDFTWQSICISTFPFLSVYYFAPRSNHAPSSKWVWI